MLKNVTLTTEKYLNEKQAIENRILRREKRREAITDYAAFFGGLTVILFCVLIAQQLSAWIALANHVLSG